MWSICRMQKMLTTTAIDTTSIDFDCDICYLCANDGINLYQQKKLCFLIGNNGEMLRKEFLLAAESWNLTLLYYLLNLGFVFVLRNSMYMYIDCTINTKIEIEIRRESILDLID